MYDIVIEYIYLMIEKKNVNKLLNIYIKEYV